MSDSTYVWNVGVAGEPLSQGYELVLNRHVAAPGNPDAPYDPFDNGTHMYGCPECGATWNADDLHLESCSRRKLLPVEYALTLWQPWADLAVTPDLYVPSTPVKPVENRGWEPYAGLAFPFRIGIAAMAFPDGYIPDGLTKKDRVKLAGNAVTPPVMAWIAGRLLQALEVAA